jgi:chromosome segregation ATPase
MSIETIEAETESLETHVQLCSQRYEQLEARLTSVEMALESLQNTVKEYVKQSRMSLIQAVSAIIVSLVGATATIVAVIINHAK